jgi:hypothetical protein
VGDDDRGAAPHHLVERVPDLVLLGRVHGRGGVVEDQDAGVGEHARAMAMRWRCPPTSEKPRSPMTVS